MVPVRTQNGRCWEWRTWAKAHLTPSQARATSPEALGSAQFRRFDGPAEMVLEGNRIEVTGADRVFHCLGNRFPDIEKHDRIGESLDTVIRLRGGKVGRTDAHMDSRLPDVHGESVLDLNARQLIVLAAAGQSYVEKNLAQALRSTFPHSLASPK